MGDFVALLRLGELAVSTAKAGLFLLPVIAAVAIAEWRAGADQKRYVTKNFLNDLVYTLFYRGGFYNVLVFAAITNALGDRLDFLRLNLLAGIPLVLGVAIFWIVGDLALYWIHRLQHRWAFLWAFHSVHHAQVRLTSVTAFRRHPVEKLLTDLIVFFILFGLVFGIPTKHWLPLTAVLTALQALQHAELTWGYGPLHRWIVSPAFHGLHHSTDPAYYNANFGQMFSIWDYIFGTAARAERPERFGVDGLDMPETLSGQLVSPFRQLYEHYRPGAKDGSAAAAERSAT